MTWGKIALSKLTPEERAVLTGHPTIILESMLKEKESYIRWLPRHYPDAELEDTKEVVNAIKAELFVRRGSQDLRLRVRGHDGCGGCESPLSEGLTDASTSIV